DEQQIGVVDQGGALRQDDVAGGDARALLETFDRDLDVLGDVGGLDLELNGRDVHGHDGAGERLTGDDDRNLDVHLLALLDHEQVDVLDDLAHRVALDVLDEDELRLALDVEVEQRVGAADDQRDLVTGKRHVDRVGAVAVDDRGDLPLGAEATGEALAEAGAKVGADLVVVGHDVLL